MKIVKTRGYAENHNRSHGEQKITLPQRLDFPRIAQVLCAALHVKSVIPPGARNPELMLWNGRIYAPDRRTIRLSALELNACLTDAALNRIESRMLLTLEAEAPYTGGRYVSYRNGVLDTETGRLEPYTPDMIFLSFKNKDFAPPADEHGKEE